MKTVLQQSHVLTAQDMSISFNTNALSVEQSDVIGLQANYSGAPVGTLQIQASIDHAQDRFGNVTNPGNWVALYVSVNGALTNSMPIPADSSPILMDLFGLSVPYIRLAYTATSGSGSMDVYMTYKRLGD